MPVPEARSLCYSIRRSDFAFCSSSTVRFFPPAPERNYTSIQPRLSGCPENAAVAACPMFFHGARFQRDGGIALAQFHPALDIFPFPENRVVGIAQPFRR